MVVQPFVTADGADPLARVPAGVVEAFHLDRIPFGRADVATGDLLRLDGKSAVVTGGGGHGSGNAICRRLAEQGADLGILDVNPDAAAATATEVHERWGVKAVAVAADVAEPAQVRAALGEVVRQLGRIDILVNNAGGSGAIGGRGNLVSQPGADFADVSLDDIDTVLRVNLIGTLLVTRVALEWMLPAGSGRIINIASEAGKMGIRGLAVYASCKSGVIGFTRNLAHEVGPNGLTTVAVCPGAMMTSRALEMMSSETSGGVQTLSRLFDRITMGRVAVPDEIASVVAFLASDAGAYVHGTTVSVGGGISG